MKELKYAMLMIIVLLMIVITGCSKKNAPQGEGPVEILYWQQVRHAGSQSDFDALAKEFQKKYPNVTVKVEEIASNDIGVKVETAIMGKTQPDVLMDSMMRMGKYANAGLLADIGDIYPNPKSVFIGSVVDMATINGKLSGIPGTYNPYGVLVNVDIFKSAGAANLIPADPKRAWTRQEFEAALTAITKNGIYGTAFFAADESSDLDTKTMIEGGTGFTLLNDNYSMVRYNEPRGIEGVAWIKSLIDRGLAVKGAETMVDDDAWELFAQQKIGVLPANLWCRAWIEERIANGELKPFEIRYVQYPNISGFEPKAPINCVIFSVFDKGDPLKVKYGKEWAKFVIESEAEFTCNKLQNAFSAQLSRSNMFAGNPENNWVATELSKYGYNPGVSAKGFADIRLLMYPEMQAVFSGQKTPERAMNDFAAAANAVLAK